jgi:hypothetical protein
VTKPKRKSSQRCTVCTHLERQRIELAMAAGTSKRAVASRFNVSSDAAWRHWRNHVTPQIKAAFATKSLRPGVELAKFAEDEGGGLLEHLKAVRQKLLVMLDSAIECADRNGAANVSARLHENFTITARLTGELMKHLPPTSVTNINIQTSPQFLNMQARLILALAPFPDARRAVIQAFRAIDETSPPLPPQMIEQVHADAA